MPRVAPGPLTPTGKTGPPSHVESTEEAARRVRRSEAVRLLVDEELTYEKIGERLGVSAKTICLDLQKAFEEMLQYRVEKLDQRRLAEERRTLRNDRAILPVLLGQVPPKTRRVVTGRGKRKRTVVVEEPPDPALVLKGQFMAHHALSKSVMIRANLFGLNAPLKVAPTNPDGSALGYPEDEGELEAFVGERLKRAAELGLPVIDVTPSGSNGNGNA